MKRLFIGFTSQFLFSVGSALLMVSSVLLVSQVSQAGNDEYITNPCTTSSLSCKCNDCASPNGCGTDPADCRCVNGRSNSC